MVNKPLNISCHMCVTNFREAHYECGATFGLSVLLWRSILDVINSVWHKEWGEVRGHLGSESHSLPRATAAFSCTAALAASPAAWRSSTATISVPSRALAAPSNSRQCARHRAAFPNTISSQLEPSKRRKTDSSVQSDKWVELENMSTTRMLWRYGQTLYASTHTHTSFAYWVRLSNIPRTNEGAGKSGAGVSIMSHFYQTSAAPPEPSDWQRCTQSGSLWHTWWRWGLFPAQTDTKTATLNQKNTKITQIWQKTNLWRQISLNYDFFFSFCYNIVTLQLRLIS